MYENTSVRPWGPDLQRLPLYSLQNHNCKILGESLPDLAVVSRANYTQGPILIVILVSSGSAKSRTHQFAVGGFHGNSKGIVWKMRECRI